MDPDMVPIVAIVVTFSSVIAFTAMIIRFKLKNKELGVREKELEMQGSNAELGPEVDALRDDLNDTRAKLTEMEERLDFAERLLSAGRASQEDRSG